jgi:hypothetical protein
MNDPNFWHHYGTYIVPVLALLLIVRRGFKAQKVRTSRSWIWPGVILLLTGFVLLSSPAPSLLAAAGFVAAAGAGVAIGYLRAAHQTLSIDPETGGVTSKATPFGTIIFAALFVARYLLQSLTSARDVPHALGLQRASEAGLIFAAMMMVASRAEIWRRVKPLLAQHRDDSVQSGAAGRHSTSTDSQSASEPYDNRR